jgi:hypothetical protein
MNNIHLHIIGSDTFHALLNELDLNLKLSLNKVSKINNNDVPVRIIFADKLKLSELKIFFLENKPTIFFLKNKNLLKENKLILQDFHISLFLPIEILSLKEIINILVTKFNFFKKSKIVINDYEIDSNQRVIIKNKTKVRLTEKELELILMLNKKNGLQKSTLLKNIWKHSTDLDSHAFETHLHRLRKKMKKFFSDRNFIIEKDSFYYLAK